MCGCGVTVKERLLLGTQGLKINSIISKVIIDTAHFHHDSQILKLLTVGSKKNKEENG